GHGMDLSDEHQARDRPAAAARAAREAGDRGRDGRPRFAAAEHALQTRDEVEELAQLLPADELEFVLLHRIDGLTQAEIAEVAAVSERTVRRALRRFDARVRTLRAVEETR